jgi:hypothetical protein
MQSPKVVACAFQTLELKPPKERDDEVASSSPPRAAPRQLLVPETAWSSLEVSTHEFGRGGVTTEEPLPFWGKEDWGHEVDCVIPNCPEVKGSEVRQQMPKPPPDEPATPGELLP